LCRTEPVIKRLLEITRGIIVPHMMPGSQDPATSSEEHGTTGVRTPQEPACGTVPVSCASGFSAGSGASLTSYKQERVRLTDILAFLRPYASSVASPVSDHIPEANLSVLVKGKAPPNGRKDKPQAIVLCCLPEAPYMHHGVPDIHTCARHSGGRSGHMAIVTGRQTRSTNASGASHEAHHWKCSLDSFDRSIQQVSHPFLALALATPVSL
jgi:hypothetical protein